MSVAAPRFAALDGLRGFAVLLVFCVHAAGNVAGVVLHRDFATARHAALAGGVEHTLFWLFRSHHGVFLFFVLSGFLIGRMWWPRPTLRPRSFLWRRTLRIYPAFLLAFVASLAFAYTSGTWTPLDLPRLAGNLAFLNGWPPARVDAFNIVTWSLFYEATFYLAFPLVAWLARAIASPTAASVTGALLPVAATAMGADPIVLSWTLLFAGAALAASAGLRGACARVPTAFVLASYLMVTTVAMLDVVPPLAAIVAFSCAAVLVLAKCLEARGFIAALFTWRPLRALGRISYSFYLVHWMIVVLVARAVSTCTPPVAAAAIFAGAFAASAVVAAASWWLAERPYFRWVGDPRGRALRPPG